MLIFSKLKTSKIRPKYEEKQTRKKFELHQQISKLKELIL